YKSRFAGRNSAGDSDRWHFRNIEILVCAPNRHSCRFSEWPRARAGNDEARMSKHEGNPNAQMTRGRARTSLRASDFVIPSSFVIRASSLAGRWHTTKNVARSFTANQLVDRAIRKEAAPEWLRCRAQGALFRMTIWRRCGLLHCSPAHGRTSV